MSDKYIIRNCPAFVLMRTATSGTYFNMCGNAKGHIECADRTDCIFKQIVGLCNEHSGTWEDCDFSNGLADEILELLDIQECE